MYHIHDLQLLVGLAQWLKETQLGVRLDNTKIHGNLSLYDMELYILTLLARQSWRIVQNTESSSFGISKVVYFPNLYLGSMTQKFNIQVLGYPPHAGCEEMTI